MYIYIYIIVVSLACAPNYLILCLITQSKANVKVVIMLSPKCILALKVPLLLYTSLTSGKFPGAHKDKTYLYNIGVCVSPDPALPGCGIVQYDTNKSTSHCIGKIASSQVSESEKCSFSITSIHILSFSADSLADDKVWVELTYTNGDSYTSHCGKESRRGRLAFLCDSLISGLVCKFRVKVKYIRG